MNPKEFRVLIVESHEMWRPAMLQAVEDALARRPLARVLAAANIQQAEGLISSKTPPFIPDVLVIQAWSQERSGVSGDAETTLKFLERLALLAPDVRVVIATTLTPYAAFRREDRQPEEIFQGVNRLSKPDFINNPRPYLNLG